MFGFGKRAKAKTAALHMVRQVLSVSMLHRTMTKEFWHDPYVLGAIWSLVISVSRQTTGGPLDHTVQGEIVAEVLSEVSDLDGHELSRLIVKFLQASEAEFALAAQRAASLTQMMVTKSITELSPEIEEAIRRSKTMKGLDLGLGISMNEMESVLSELYQMWLIEPFRERLEEWR